MPATHGPDRRRGATVCLGLILVLTVSAATARAGRLEDELGRSETRVWSEAYPLLAGVTVGDARLVERLERQGYRRVHDRPTEPGTYFYGNDVFWIWLRAHRHDGQDLQPSLVGLRLDRSDGRILGAVGPGDRTWPLDRAGLLHLEPEVLAESLDGDRATRRPIDLDDLPEHVWRTLLAAEDARFFDHPGVDARAVARAALANAKSGGVAQGGSTITQQLIKYRDLTPKRSLGRKVSEAVRALALEAEYDKREILEAYLNQVYYGHVDGLAVHGIGAASEVYFSKPASRLDLAEAATLAALVQAPNRLDPIEHPETNRERRDWVLSRMQELDWATSAGIAEARATPVRVRPSAPRYAAPAHYLTWVRERAHEEAPERLERGRGVAVHGTLDPLLQDEAERAVREGLTRLRSGRGDGGRLQAALVAIDLRAGGVLAWVGGDPGRGPVGFDRVRSARRQPGSAVKPFVLLEAFERCGTRERLSPATRVADEPLRVDLPSGAWQPSNFDGRFRGVVDLRTTLEQSLNVPTVRVARFCGIESVAERYRRAGLDLPPDPPPSFVLGAVETTPFELAAAYTAIARNGRRFEPIGVTRIERPAGRGIDVDRAGRRRVAHPASAWLVAELMHGAVESGTARTGRIDGCRAAAKTGSTSDLRDAWFAGWAGSVLTVVWVGMDDDSRLGLTGSAAAGPIWQAFMQVAVPARPGLDVERPGDVVERWVDERSGLLVDEGDRHAHSEWFRRGTLPRKNRAWRRDAPEGVIH